MAFMEPGQNILSREAIEEFRLVYEQEFGESLSDDQAKELALRVLHFFYILTQHAPTLTAEMRVR